ncbi:heme NO-binding domain-containing protein [Paenibacillus koleovorans]|uniref:heme NO-binding domain-containing protein n=1 Tax=Paenibacillus koleovorans TaxID=121608 RepID=UPI000FD87450|nr:heme NO-binding domain-containing protein [Paenibacillus koleovorans]
MKGMVFTTFLEMVEERFSPQMADKIIELAELPSGGAYTSLGTYSHEEIISLVVQLSKQTDIPVSDLVRVFGEYMFGQLAAGYPQFVAANKSVYDFLLKVDSYIHVEVRKLYPDAELPGFSYETPSPGVMVMTYRSSRPFADLAEGLIVGAIKHFEEDITLERENLEDAGGTAARFTMTKRETN